MNRDELITALQASAAEKPRAVFIKGWGTVYVRALTVEEVNEQVDADNELEVKTVDADGKEVIERRKDKHRLARSAARLLCDENGKRLLDPNNAEDVALLAKQPWKTLQKVLSEGDVVEEGNGGN